MSDAASRCGTNRPPSPWSIHSSIDEARAQTTGSPAAIASSNDAGVESDRVIATSRSEEATQAGSSSSPAETNATFARRPAVHQCFELAAKRACGRGEHEARPRLDEADLGERADDHVDVGIRAEIAE